MFNKLPVNFKKITMGGFMHKLTRLGRCNVRSLAMACGIMLLASACADNNLMADPEDSELNGGNGATVTRYFTFALATDNGVPATRATDKTSDNQPDVIDGDKDKDSKINNLLIIFYDDEGNYLHHVTSEDLTPVEEENPDAFEDIKWETYITTKIEFIEGKEDKLASVFCIVNYDDDVMNAVKATSETELKNLEDVVGATLSKHTGDNGFIMTTPGHYVKNGNDEYEYKVSEPKEAPIFYVNKNAAQNNPVILHVERLASRVDFEIDEETIQKIEVLYGTDVVELLFHPTHMGLEAIEENTYIGKKMQPSLTYFTNSTTSEKYPDKFADWVNYVDGMRTFWAESVNFKDAIDHPIIYPNTGKKGETPAPTLDYNTSGDILSDACKLEPKPDETKVWTRSVYTKEHTFANTELTKEGVDNPYAVPTSIVLYGYYTGVKIGTDLTKEEEDKGTDPIDDILKYSFPDEQKHDATNVLTGGFYIRNIDMERTGKNSNSDKKYQYRLYLKNDEDLNSNTEDELFASMLQEQYVVFYQDTEGKYHPLKYGDKTDGVLVIENTNRIFLNNDWVKVPNAYCLQLKSVKWGNANLYYSLYNSETGGSHSYTLITSDNLEDVNKALQDQLGYATYYEQGKAFFFSPIPHYTGEKNPFPNKSYKGEFNFKDKKPDHNTGDFAVVRNHIYSLTVGGISSLGYGKTDDEDIPLPTLRFGHDIYYFDLELKILPWNTFKYTFDI